ncbi:hypothetical protein EUX98_g1636 [Antrodiella citrinella]|uniref:BIR-domain-containing protein n=1 Tax=Antrodiella citrinella TaxID=2447956 RepID=A0A4S4N3V5_9APHY|nr:hypothetical protein EUX98_g1636 [Antrodiella citrinella]
MAKAGFVYTPQTAGDDTATCFYCGISLSGWDDDDDPMDEHRKREERTRVACPFFASVASVASTTKVTSKPPSRVSSKPPSRVASQSKINPRAVVDADPEGSDEEETVAQPSKPVGSRGKKSTASGSSSAPGTATAPRRATRSKSAKGKTAEASEDEDVEVGGSESETGTKVSKAKRKGKATGKAHMESVQEEKVEADIEEGEGEADVEAEPEPAKPKRGRPPAAKKATTSSRKKKAPDDTETQPVSTSTTKHTRTRSKANLQSDVEVEDYKQPPTKTRVTSSKKPPTPATVAPESVAQKSQTKTRKSSSTSDDAGYATAELQMDVDAVQEVPRHDTKTSDHDAVLENHDRDSGLAESIGQSSPPKHSSPLIESSSRREVSAQNTPALQSVASSNKAKKGKAKMQMEVAMLMSPPRQSSSAPMDTDDDVPTINYTTQSLQNGVTFSSATSSSSAPQPTGPSTPKSKTVQFLPATPEPDPPAPSESHLPDSVMPFLANMPTEKLSYLTEDESAMTIEQYIRREIEVQYQRFKEDGERKIALFQEKVAETRRIIESL